MANYRKPKQVAPISTRGFGTGLTRHTREVYNPSPHAAQAEPGSELSAEIGQLFRLACPSPIERINDLEQWAIRTLQSHGLPDRLGYVFVDGTGGWRWLEPEQIVAECEVEGSGTLMSAMAFAQLEEESLGWFAATAVEFISAMRKAFAENNGLAAVEIAFQMGALGERCWWKFNHETAAEAGYRMRDGRAGGARAGSAGAKRKGDRNRQAVIEAVKLLWTEKPSLIGKFNQSASILASRLELYT